MSRHCILGSLLRRREAFGAWSVARRGFVKLASQLRDLLPQLLRLCFRGRLAGGSGLHFPLQILNDLQRRGVAQPAGCVFSSSLSGNQLHFEVVPLLHNAGQLCPQRKFGGSHIARLTIATRCGCRSVFGGALALTLDQQRSRLHTVHAFRGVHYLHHNNTGEEECRWSQRHTAMRATKRTSMRPSNASSTPSEDCTSKSPGR